MARIKRRTPKKPEIKKAAKRPTRQEAELVAQERINQKVIKLPEFRETLSLNCTYQGKAVVCDLEYNELVSQFPKFRQLIHQFQVATEVWARETKGSKTAEASFYAQKLFVEFISSSNNAQPISSLSELKTSVLRQFISYLQGKASTPSVRKHYTGITGILRCIYKSSYSEIPEIGTFTRKFPTPPREKKDQQKGIPSLDQRSFNELVLVLQDHFDVIKALPKKVKALLNDGQPTLDEMETGSFRLKDRKEDQDRNLSLILKEYYHKYSDFPLQWDVDDSHDFLRNTGHVGKDARYKMHPAHELFQYVQYLKNPLLENKHKGISAFLSHIYPTIATVSVCLYLLKVQTGWNLSVLLGLEFGDDFEGLFKPCPISQDYVLLVGEKSRGVQAEKYHRTKKNNKYGAYRVLRFLWGFGQELRAHTGSKSPWVYLKVVFDKNKPITNELEEFTHHTYSTSLCKAGLIHDDNGHPLKGFAFESIRKNLAGIEDEISGYDIQKMASMLQNSPDVAVTHYRNKETSEKRLRNAQETWVHHFTYFQGSFNQKMLLANPSDEELNDNDVEGRSKVQIITTDGITPVSICKNPYRPDWHGYKTSVGEGERCSYFQGCSNCTQCVIFTETLPFIYKRLKIIDLLRSKMNAGDWETAYHIEWHAWKEVLENWPEQEDIVKAEALSRMVKLPIRPQLYGA